MAWLKPGWISVSSELILLSAAFLYALGSVVRKVALQADANMHSLNAIHKGFGFLFLLFLKPFLEKKNKVSVDSTLSKPELKTAGSSFSIDKITWYFAVGVGGAATTFFFTYALIGLDPAIVFFYTNMYAAITPIAESLIPGIHRPASLSTYGATFLTVLGIFLISNCGRDCAQLNEYAIYALFGAFCWSYVLILLHLAGKCGMDSIDMTMYSNFASTVLLLAVLVYAMIFYAEGQVYSMTVFQFTFGVASSIFEGAAYLLTSVGMQEVVPSNAVVIVTLDAPISAFLDMIVLNEFLSGMEIAGCCVMVSSYYVLSLSLKKKGVPAKPVVAVKSTVSKTANALINSVPMPQRKTTTEVILPVTIGDVAREAAD